MDKYKQGIIGAFIFLAEYHILWNLFYPYLWKLPYQQFEFIFAILLLAAAVFYMIRNAAREPEYLKRFMCRLRYGLSREHIFLIALFMWFAVDCILQQCIDGKNYVQINDWKLFCSALAAFVFFPFAKVVGDNKARSIIELMMHLTVIMYTVFWTWVLWQYYHMNFITFPSGTQLSMVGTHLLEAGINRNVTAAHSAVMVSLCIYMIMTRDKKLRTAYVFAFAIHIMVVMLTDCRTSYVAVVCTVCVAICLSLWRHCSFKKRLTGSIIAQALIMVIVALLCIFVFYMIKKGAFRILEHCIELYSDGSPSTTTVIRPYNNLSGREDIWIGAIKMLLSSTRRFFLGVIPSQIGNTLKSMGLLNRMTSHCHNVLLEVAASLGVPAMLFYAWFLLSVLRHCIHVIGMQCGQFKCPCGILIVLLCLVVIDMAESFLFGPTSANMPVFHIFAGWITVMDDNDSSFQKGRYKKRK